MSALRHASLAKVGKEVPLLQVFLHNNGSLTVKVKHDRIQHYNVVIVVVVVVVVCLFVCLFFCL